METHALPSSSELFASLALFNNVTNAPELRKLVMSAKITAALIKPSMVVDQFQLLVAATKAAHNQRYQKLTTRTLHSEVLYSLSATKNISDCFRRFGISDSDTCVLVLEIHKKDESQMDDIHVHVQGELVPMSRLSEHTDVTLVRKLYKIKDEELTVGSLLEAVVNRIASKDFVAY